MLHPFERNVFLHSRGLLQPGDRVVVAISGGPDSTALLSALKAALPVHLIAAHLDHGLRSPEECERDREAAQALAESLDVPFELGLADTREEARERGTGSLEAAARAVRYRFLGEVAERFGADAVALGHTANDQAETVLMRVLRGTGLRGLGGIPRRRRLSREQPDVIVVRPILSLSRDEVTAYVRDKGLTTVQDGSNADPTYLRNRLRNDVLPLLRTTVNPAVDDALLRLADQARVASQHLDHEARALLESARDGAAEAWDAHRLSAADPAIRGEALALIVSDYAPDRAATKHVRALQALLLRRRGGVELPGGVRLRLERGSLAREFEIDPVEAESLELCVPGEVIDEIAQLRFEARVVDRDVDTDCNVDPAQCALLDAARVDGNLTIRRRQAGDRFWPLGGPGRRTLKRFFIDQKVPRQARDSIPVVTLRDRPVWVVGHRIDDTFKVTPSTARVLELRVSVVCGQEA